MFDKEELALREIVILSMTIDQIKTLHDWENKNHLRMVTGMITRKFNTNHLTRLKLNTQYDKFENDIIAIYKKTELGLIYTEEIPTYLEVVHSFDWKAFNDLDFISYNLEGTYYNDINSEFIHYKKKRKLYFPKLSYLFL